MALGGQAAPAPPPPQPLVIEPPPWVSEETGPLLPLASAASTPAPTALEVMRAEDGDTEWPDDPTLPHQRYEPLIRPLPPAPDWRQEEIERDRVRAAEAQERLEPSRETYPARPAREKPARWPA